MGSQACMLKLKVKDQSLSLLQVYGPTSVSEYQTIVEDVIDALQSRFNKIRNLFGGFQCTHGTNNETCKGVIGRHGDPA